MKIITAETMQELDRQTIKECGIPGLQLMENAGRSCAEVVIAEFGTPGRCTVMAGKGNNGGDGYVIARLLAVKGWRVTVILLAERAQVAGDAALNLAMLSGVEVHCCTVGGRLAALHSDEIFQSDVIVDALFGTGLNSDVSGVYLEAVTLMNASGRPIVAVDIPSGVHGTTGRVLGEAVRAEITVTFALAKSGQILYPGPNIPVVWWWLTSGFRRSLWQRHRGMTFWMRKRCAPCCANVTVKPIRGHSAIVWLWPALPGKPVQQHWRQIVLSGPVPAW